MSLTNAAVSSSEEVAQRKNALHRPTEAEDAPRERYWRKLIPRTLPQVLLLALAILVASLQVGYLLSVRTQIPLQDDWNYLDKMFRALDRHQVAAWVMDSTNGHFVVPGALGSWVSWRYFSLDLSPLRLLNFPICLASFLLMAHVINLNVKSRFLRFYLYAGVSFVIFNLCFWEHFAQANGFGAMLSVLFGSVGLYYVSKGVQLSPRWKTYRLLALIFLLASVLSLGGGFAAVAAASGLFALCTFARRGRSRLIPRYEIIVLCLAYAAGVLVIISHPLFHLKSRIVKAAFHSALVAGSAGSAYLDKNTALAQNVAFVCGLLLITASLSIVFHFVTKETSPGRLLPTFSLGLVLFGLFGCIAVAIARAYLPDAEFLNSRYTLYPSLIVLGTLLYFACSRAFLLANVWCFAGAVYFLATAKEYQMGFFREQLDQKMRIAIINSDHLSDEQLKAALYWRENNRAVRRVVARMRRDKLNLFRETPRGNNEPR